MQVPAIDSKYNGNRISRPKTMWTSTWWLFSTSETWLIWVFSKIISIVWPTNKIMFRGTETTVPTGGMSEGNKPTSCNKKMSTGLKWSQTKIESRRDLGEQLTVLRLREVSEIWLQAENPRVSLSNGATIRLAGIFVWRSLTVDQNTQTSRNWNHECRKQYSNKT